MSIRAATPTASTAATVAKDAPIKSMRALAKLVDRDISVVSRWAKRPDWPFARLAPWTSTDVPKILQWVLDNLKGGFQPSPMTEPLEGESGDPDDTASLRKEKLRKEIAKLQEQIKGFETDNRERAGKLLSADAVEQEWASIANLMRNAFQNLASQIVPLALADGLPHEAASGFQNKVEAAVAGILRHLSKGGSDDTD